MTAASTRVRLRVSPGSGRSEIVGRHGGAWRVRVAAPPDHGRANEAVLKLVADALAVPRAAVTLVSGHGGRDKIVELSGIGPTVVEHRLASASSAGRARKDMRP